MTSRLEKEIDTKILETKGKFWELVQKYSDPYDERWLDEGVIYVEDLVMILEKIFNAFPGKADGNTALEASQNLIHNVATYLKDTFGYEYKGIWLK